MKKFLLIILITVIVLAAGAGAYFYFNTRFPLAIENVLPKEPLVYIKFSDTQKNWNKLTATQFWQNVSSIDYAGVMAKSKANRDSAQAISLIKAQLSDPQVTEIIAKFLGREVAVAVYPTNVDLEKMSKLENSDVGVFVEELLANVFIVTRLDPQIQLAEFIAGVTKQVGADIALDKSDYNHHTIYAFTIPEVNVKLNFVRIRDLLVISVGGSAAKLSVDVAGRKKESLMKDADFQLAQKRFLKSPSMICYVHLKALLAGLEQTFKDAGALTTADASSTQDQVAAYFADIKGLESLGVSSVMDPQVQIKTDVLLNKNEMSPNLGALLSSCSPKENRALNLVPHDVLGYYWVGCFDFAQTWSQWKERFPNKLGKTSSEEDSGAPQEIFGLNIEQDILPAFGSEIGGYLSDIVTIGDYPSPNVLLFIQIKEKAKIEQLLSKFADQLAANLQKEDYSNVTINYLTLPTDNDVEFSFCLLDDYLLFAPNRQIIKNAIDAKNDSSLALVSSDDFKDVNLSVIDKTINIQYVKVDKMMQKAATLVDWLEKQDQKEEDKRAAFRTGTEKKLMDLKTEMTAKEAQLKETQDALMNLSTRIKEIESRGEAVVDKQKEASVLQNKIDGFKKEIAANQDRVKELDYVIRDYQAHAVDPVQRQAYLDNLTYPLLKSFEFIRTYGAKMTLEDDVLEFIMSFKIE